MAIKRELSCKNLLFVLGLAFFLYDVTIVVAHTSESSIFDVTKFDAKGNGKPEYTEDGENSNSLAFIQAWQKACNSIGPSKLVIPKGTFVVAQVLFAGPCQSHVTVELHGTILADPDPSVFPNQELIVFQQVEGATFTGTGAINVNQPPLAADPEKDFVFSEIMPSIKFSNATSCVVDGIHSMNPSAFHLLVENSHNISIINTNFEATTVKPNTHSNAIYISGSSLVAVSNSRIKSGDDCITVSGGSSDISITGVTCVAGQGISVGAQLDGFHPDYNVKKVTVKSCTFKGTQFGARINPRPTDKPGEVSNIIFEDLTMDQTLNPIVIKQDYPPIPDKPNYAKITNVHFKNIRGTTTSNTPLSFACNKAAPCDGIEVVDVFLNITSTIGKIANNILSASCANAKVVFSGKHDGLNCA
ncbi:exopolygalacturonase-like [Chenopodium quinoa]|uniref:exopolygalacturonase-like n=1 Tax=Chenopodium quinoa TaxID=63459 RepID=UPI000B781BA1|nr:exopolygalacturonase-like [Chenopodium quinoa]